MARCRQYKLETQMHKWSYWMCSCCIFCLTSTVCVVHTGPSVWMDCGEGVACGMQPRQQHRCTVRQDKRWFCSRRRLDAINDSSCLQGDGGQLWRGTSHFALTPWLISIVDDICTEYCHVIDGILSSNFCLNSRFITSAGLETLFCILSLFSMFSGLGTVSLSWSHTTVYAVDVAYVVDKACSWEVRACMYI